MSLLVVPERSGAGPAGPRARAGRSSARRGTPGECASAVEVRDGMPVGRRARQVDRGRRPSLVRAGGHAPTPTRSFVGDRPGREVHDLRGTSPTRSGTRIPPDPSRRPLGRLRTPKVRGGAERTDVGKVSFDRRGIRAAPRCSGTGTRAAAEEGAGRHALPHRRSRCSPALARTAGVRRVFRLRTGGTTTVTGMSNEQGPPRPAPASAPGPPSGPASSAPSVSRCFYRCCRCVVGVVALVLAAFGVLPGVAQLFQAVTGP